MADSSRGQLEMFLQRGKKVLLHKYELKYVYRSNNTSGKTDNELFVQRDFTAIDYQLQIYNSFPLFCFITINKKREQKLSKTETIKHMLTNK